MKIKVILVAKKSKSRDQRFSSPIRFPQVHQVHPSRHLFCAELFPVQAEILKNHQFQAGNILDLQFNRIIFCSMTVRLKLHEKRRSNELSPTLQRHTTSEGNPVGSPDHPATSRVRTPGVCKAGTVVDRVIAVVHPRS